MKAWTDGSGNHRCCYVLENGVTRVIELRPDTTSNEAEYYGVIACLESDPSESITEIFSDSQLMVKQLNREYGIKSARLRSLALRVWNNSFGVKFTWIPREENRAGKVLG